MAVHVLRAAPSAACTASAAPACKPCAGCTGAEQSQILLVFFFFPLNRYFFLSPHPPSAVSMMHRGEALRSQSCGAKEAPGDAWTHSSAVHRGCPRAGAQPGNSTRFIYKVGQSIRSIKGSSVPSARTRVRQELKKGSMGIHWQAARGNCSGVGRAGLSRAYGCPHGQASAGGIGRE